ncbi:MAG TPA: ATP-binding protein [Ktedonobacterales bacterium]|nr:ATP-binding protein [Ktedonobacterales bacterium]
MKQISLPTQFADWWESLRLRWQQLVPRAADPSARMFQTIQRRLILWYGGVLAVILLVAGILLYVSMQNVELSPINSQEIQATQGLTREWQLGDNPCDGPNPAALFIACYGPDGGLLAANRYASYTPAFSDAALARTALTSTSARDIVDGGNGIGRVSRYATIVRDPNTNQILGVIQVGDPIEGQEVALSTLLTLLLLVGALTLVGACVGGFVLAQRALAPAHLAFSRQQAFIADASHELRTPLTLLRADAEVLLRGRERLADDDVALLEDIVTESSQMSTLTNNLLTLARLDSGTARVARDVVDLADVASAVVRRTDKLAAERQIALQFEGEQEHPLVIGDQHLLEQATLILVDNAIKYNVTQGRVVVQVFRAGNQAGISVRDTGIGIAPEHLAHLGERFYRPDDARSRETGGTGLGLSIAHGIAHAHHGMLTLASEPRKGTAATLSLSLARVPTT